MPLQSTVLLTVVMKTSSRRFHSSKDLKEMRRESHGNLGKSPSRRAKVSAKLCDKNRGHVLLLPH